MRRRTTRQDPKGAPDSWREALLHLCENCGRGSRLCWLVGHHVVRRQHVERADGDIWDPRNCMTLCDGSFSCHARHHARLHVIRSYRLPQSAIEFAVDLYGRERAYEYLRREYFDFGTGRFEALLEEAV